MVVKQYIVETYEFGKHIHCEDMFFNTPEKAQAYIDSCKSFNRKEKLNGFTYKLMVEEY